MKNVSDKWCNAIYNSEHYAGDIDITNLWYNMSSPWFSITRMRRHVDITESAISNIANHVWDQDDLEAVSCYVSIEYSVDDMNTWYNTLSP